MFRRTAILIAATAALSLTACGGRKSGLPSGDLAASKVTTIGVNSYLWRAALDTLSFMPLVQTDGDAGGTLAVRRVKGSSGWCVDVAITPTPYLNNGSFRILHSHLKPESARVHSAATVRAATFCIVEGQGLEFVSALGFV